MSAPRLTRMLCQFGCGIKRVIAADGNIRTLECLHERPAGTLPLQTGRISMEGLRTQIGQQLFPAQRSDEMTSRRLWVDYA
jgi:hypothetical protein